MKVVTFLLACLLAACGGGAAGSQVISATAAPSPAPGASSSMPYTCPSGITSTGTLDCTALALGDRKYSTSGPRAGYIYVCQALSGTPPVTSAPWLNTSSGTWNALMKIAVSGNVSWPGSFSESVTGASRSISGNGLPAPGITTGAFPIQSSDPAYAYDRNPNSISAQRFAFSLPATPSVAATPACLNMGPIGITVTGVAIYNAFDAAGYDAVAREEQDSCHGHPDQSSTYHYHGWLQACVPDSGSVTQNSSLLGYAADGFGIYGAWYNDKLLTTADLDECHGTTSQVLWNGQLTTIYHYVSTYDFPYTLGCYKGGSAARM